MTTDRRLSSVHELDSSGES